MAYISSFMYCEDVFQDNSPEGQKTHIVGPLLIFRPLFVPGQFTFSIAAGLMGVDTTTSHQIQLRFNDPDGTNVINSGILNLPPTSEESDLPRELQGFTMTLGFKNVAFRKEGEYKTEVYFDNELLGSFPIHVKGIEVS